MNNQEKLILAALPGVYIAVGLDGKVLFAFGDGWKFFSLSSEQVIGSKVYDLKGTPFRQRNVQTCREKKEPITVVTPEGSRQFECTYKLVEDTSGHDSFVFCSARDKTLEMQLDQKIIDSTFEISSASRIQSLEKLAAGFAHEINNPLTIIQGQANSLFNLLKKGMLTTENGQKYIDSLNRNVARISQIVKSLRDAASSGSEEPETGVKLDEVVRKALDLVRNQKNMNDISVQVSNHIMQQEMVWGREMQLVSALEQILLNSIDAIEKNTDKWIKVDLSQSEGDLLVAVTDSGLGIAEDLRHKIMLPFFSTRDVGKGSGVGLNLAKRNVEANAGILSLDAECKNTRFVIRFSRKIRDVED